MRILLFKTGAIGDTIMTTPMIRQLRRAYPKAKIDYLIGNSAAPVIEENTNINKIITFDPKIFFKKKLFQYLRLIKKIRKRKYNIIFVLDKHWIFNYTAKLFKIPERIGFDRMGKEGIYLTHKIYYDGTKHEIYYYLDLLKGLNIKPNYDEAIPEIFLSEKSVSEAKKMIKKYSHNNKIIVIIPGGGNNPGQRASTKLWSVRKYSELTKILVKKGYKIVLLGDKNDKMLCNLIYKESPSIVNLCSKTTIKQSAAIMKNAYKIICNDSGPMHIASCVNNNIISLFGPTDPKRFAPLNKKSIYIWKSGKVLNDIYGKFIDDGGKSIDKIKVEDVIKCI